MQKSTEPTINGGRFQYLILFITNRRNSGLVTLLKKRKDSKTGQYCFNGIRYIALNYIRGIMTCGDSQESEKWSCSL